ncbi:myb-like protein AA [Uranotaenia lowii]|uniref:myb-like protein AA n=1 Tax=Uranotaenia lowii TaxID=190385 RepID=UPI00247ADE39|nr:myb-like protein AA [Uranotaenia lowii]XP_055610503.1 myb-like protein AA [Uranotaenia lowii]XP_055610504.1 myb-like protein AA [Uranotaenia lowii]
MSFNTLAASAAVMKMAAVDWETPASRDHLVDSRLSGASNRSSSSRSSSPSPPSPYSYIDSANFYHHNLQKRLQPLHLQYQPGGSKNSNAQQSRRSHSGSRTGDRNWNQPRLLTMDRGAYVNRSFMHYDEQVDPTIDYLQQQPDRRNDRRRHSSHLITALPPTSKMDDLKQRFDEYHSSAAVGMGNGGVPRGKRRLSRQLNNNNNNSNHQLAGLTTGGASRLNLGYGVAAGSRSLVDVYDSRTTPAAEGRLGQQQKQQKQQRQQQQQQQKGNGKTPKRGSRSSQGSTDSSHSSHSASSGSLLLTVANLENFAKIHKKHESSYGTSKAMEEYLSSTVGVVPTAALMDAIGSKYNSNIMLQQQQQNTVDQTDQVATTSSAIIAIEDITPEYQQQNPVTLDPVTGLPTFHRPTAKTKDPDSVSMASSTHFTMINGIGGPQRRPKSGICSRGHQITILIVTMSFVFMVGICAAVFFLEMRAREMPR